MKYARLVMRHRATVLRNTATGKSRYNTPVAPDYEPLDDPLPCRFWAIDLGAAGTRTVEGSELNVARQDLRLMVPLDADVTTADRIGDIVDRRGRTVLAGGPRGMRIDADIVVPGSHREMALMRISEGV